MQKINTILLCLVYSCSLLAKELTIWTSNEGVQKAIELVGQEFTKDFGIAVKVFVLNKDLTNQFKTAALSGKGPDIFTWAHDVVGELASSGFIAPVSFSKKRQRDFYPVALDAFRYKGKLYGYPYDMEAIALLYNKKLVKQVPTTFDQLLSFAKKRQGYTFLYDLSNFFFSFPLLSANGGYVFKNRAGTLDTTDIGLDNVGAVQGAQLLRRLVTEKVIPESTDRSIAFNLFNKGELPFTIDGPWAVNELKKAKIDFGVAPLPRVGTGIPKPFVGVHGFIIRRSSSNRDIAIEFIENYIMTKRGIRTLYDSDPRTPARKDVVEDLKDDKILQGFLASAKRGVPMPNVPQMGAVWGAMGSALRSVVTSSKQCAEILEFARRQIEHSLKKK